MEVVYLLDKYNVELILILPIRLYIVILFLPKTAIGCNSLFFLKSLRINDIIFAV